MPKRHYESRAKSFASLQRKRTIERLRSFTPATDLTPQPYRRNDYSSLPSVTSKRFSDGDVSNTPKMSPEMQERERIAQQEIARKRKCTAPAYNKGAYQYVATTDQAKDVGR